ncbi:hypothetical protein CFK39_07975 [Brachybacterium avium]|uniref:Uncharacterized protein n=1 Tax=Brachybacterium avium TaxID=2017485 RepID=A0A220UCH9_9MICO|nr:hypothetical protein CFK39_07975 [Brachybacterium avium]
MGIIASLLTACGLGGRSDAAAVQEALRVAVEALPEHRTGKVQFQDSNSAGTTISGVLVLAGRDRAQIEQSLLVVLEAVSDTYDQQPGVRTAFVRIEAHPEGDRATRVMSADAVAPSSGANTTTEDLTAYFAE